MLSLSESWGVCERKVPASECVETARENRKCSAGVVLDLLRATSDGGGGKVFVLLRPEGKTVGVG